MESYLFPFSCMGTRCALRFYASSVERAHFVRDMVLKKLHALDLYYTNYSPDSFTAQINKSAGDPRGIKVDGETALLLDYAQECYERSEGLFDITAGLLRRAWEYQGPTTPCLPSQEALDKLLTRVGWDKLLWQKPRLFLPRGMHLDFGGVVKEYAADTAAALCYSLGIEHGFVDMSGDICVMGPHPDGRPWMMGVRDPHNPEESIALIPMMRGGLATSGDYERCVVIDGVRYGHILNPKTGWPTKGVSSVSVVGDFCLVAGSLATMGMLKGEVSDFLSQEDLPHLVLDSEGAPTSCKDFLLAKDFKEQALRA